MCRLFTHDSHDLKADVPNLAVKQSGGRTFLVMPRFQHRFLVGKWFGGTCNAFKLMPTTSHDSQQHAMFPCVSLTSTDDPNHFQGSKKNATVVANVSHLPAVKRTKKYTYRPQMRINSRPKHAIWVVFCCGMGVATPKIHQAARNKQICRC